MAVSLRQNNPFISGYVITYKEGDQSLERDLVVYTPSPNDKLHTITAFDTLDLLSYDFYGDSKYWWILADCNNILNPFILTTGSNIIIPDISKIKTQFL